MGIIVASAWFFEKKNLVSKIRRASWKANKISKKNSNQKAGFDFMK
jgi:hypothetical protein